MHKKENMLLLAIASSHRFHTHSKYKIEISGDKQAPHTHTKKKKKKSARMINERLKDKTETVKKDRAPDTDKPLPVTMSRPRGPACKGGPFVLLCTDPLSGVFTYALPGPLS